MENIGAATTAFVPNADDVGFAEDSADEGFLFRSVFDNFHDRWSPAAKADPVAGFESSHNKSVLSYQNMLFAFTFGGADEHSY